MEENELPYSLEVIALYIKMEKLNFSLYSKIVIFLFGGL